MQLSMFNELEETRTNIESTEQEGNKTIYKKWRMYEFLERIAGKTARLLYETEGIKIKVPIQIGEMMFSNISTVRTFPSFVALETSNCILRVSARRVDSLVEEDNVLRFRYISRESDYKDTNPQIIESLSSLEIMTFEAKRANLPNLEDISTIEELKDKLLGRSVKLQLHLRDDFFSSIEDTLAFELTNLKVVDGQLQLKGTNGVEVVCNGFYNMRFGSGVLLDCRTNEKYFCIHIVD